MVKKGENILHAGADPGIFVRGGGGSNLPKNFDKPKKKKKKKKKTTKREKGIGASVSIALVWWKSILPLKQFYRQYFL